MPPTRILRLTCAALVVLATPARAQAPPAPGSASGVTTSRPAPSPQDAAEAKKRFAAGLKLYSEHAYTEALAEFESSYRLGGRPSALRNIAQCHRDMRHFADAYEAYDRLLKVHGAQLSAGDRDAVTHALDELSDLSGAISVASSEAGANVELDGTPLGVTPLSAAKRVSLASHHVVVTKAGFEPFEKDVSVQSNQSVTVDAALAPEVTTGHVIVREENGDPVNVFIDGQDKGPAPWEGDLAPGDHTVEAKGPKFAAERRSFSLTKKQRLDLAIDATTTLGHIRVTTIPASASITFDGQNVGTGVWDADIAPGAHRIEVAMEGQPHAERVVNVVRGQLIVLDVPLQTGGEGAPVYRGFYTRIAPFAVLSPSRVAAYAAGYGTCNSPPCGYDKTHFGFGGALHIGYSFDPLAVEFFGAFQVEHYDFESPSPPQGSGGSNHSGGVTGVDAFFGAGARVTSHGPTVRVTAALAPGIAVHNVTVDDGYSGGGSSGSACNSSLNNCSNNSNNQGNGSVGYVAPGFMLDGGMLVGNSPGAKFFLGVVAWLDFAPTLYWGPDTQAPLPASDFYPGRGLKAVGGPQFYVGPSLGIQFGH
jgi:hypothetical protein